jgi:hypothetical protein
MEGIQAERMGDRTCTALVSLAGARPAHVNSKMVVCSSTARR